MNIGGNANGIPMVQLIRVFTLFHKFMLLSAVGLPFAWLSEISHDIQPVPIFR